MKHPLINEKDIFIIERIFQWRVEQGYTSLSTAILATKTMYDLKDITA